MPALVHFLKSVVLWRIHSGAESDGCGLGDSCEIESEEIEKKHDSHHESSDDEDQRTFLKSSVGINDLVSDADLSGWGMLRCDNNLIFLDPTDCNDDYFEYDDWAESDELEDMEECELSSWFVSVEDDKLHEKELQEKKENQPVDLLTKLYQEMADAEYAQELVSIT